MLGEELKSLGSFLEGVVALAMPFVFIWIAIISMFSVLGLLFFHWMLVHSRIKKKGPKILDPELCIFTYDPTESSVSSIGSQRTAYDPSDSDGCYNSAVEGSGISTTESFLEEVTSYIRFSYPLQKATKFVGVCSLCSQHIAPGHQIRSLPCKHPYHNLCLLKHVVQNDLFCPECHISLKDNSPLAVQAPKMLRKPTTRVN